MNKVFDELNNALGKTAVYEGVSSFSDTASYFTYSSDRYCLIVSDVGDVVTLKNITKQERYRFVNDPTGIELVAREMNRQEAQ